MSETHRVIATIGLAFGLIGGVLVGVEAVRLQNIERLEGWIRSHRVWILGIGVAALWCVFALVWAVADLPDPATPWWVQIFAAIGYTLATLVVWWLLGILLSLFVRFLGWIRATWDDGAIGIIGIFLVIAGFGLEIGATWVE